MQHLKRLLKYSNKYLWINILGLILSLGFVWTGLYIPYITREIVDDVLLAGQFDKMRNLIIVLLGVTLIRIISEYFRRYAFEYSSQKVLYDFRSELYGKMQEQSFEYYDKVRTGLLMNRMVGDLRAVRQLLNNGYLQVFEGTFTIISTLIMMISLNKTMTLSFAVIAPITFFAMRAMSAQIRPVYRGIRKSFEDLSSTVQENLTGIRVVKAFGREEYEIDKFNDVTSDWSNKNIMAADIRSVYNPIRRLISGFSTVIILLLGGYLVINGDITIGTLVAFNSYMMMLSMPINNASNLVNQWENAKASLEKIFELLDEEITITNKEGALMLENCQGNVEFRNVDFRYDNEMVLKDINLKMKPGTVTAIMGSTGSGKSTIINLIARFYDCTSGAVLVDGIDVRDYDYNDLRRNIGIVFQETLLFSDTIANNIAFGRPNASMNEIRQAAEIADAHDFIMEMPDGYNTVIGERGLGLSGGQRQRIALARGILYNPKILILDDATSSVDMETEHVIQQTLGKIMDQRTTLIVAHRISSVKDADQIIILDEGRIVEQGTHEELIELQGRYYQTFIEQYSDYKDEDPKKIKLALGGIN